MSGEVAQVAADRDAWKEQAAAYRQQRDNFQAVVDRVIEVRERRAAHFTRYAERRRERGVRMSEQEIEAVLRETGITANTWQSAARRLAEENHDLRVRLEAAEAARADAFRSPYDEDGYCEGCGNGSWKPHAPDCGWADLRDARANAWDEGYEAGSEDDANARYDLGANPYRGDA